MNATIVAFLGLYYLVVLGIGFFAVRRGAGDDLEGFLLGGRRLGAMVTALTLQSTAMSGFMFLGAGALGFTHGYWALWYAAGDIGGGVVVMSLIGRRMRKLSQRLGSLTSIEYLENRYPAPATRLLAACLSLFLLTFYVIAQCIAGGKGLALVTGISYPVALILAVAIILVYTFLGGYLAVAYTDFFQSLVMLLGVVWILAAALLHVGGLTEAKKVAGWCEAHYIDLMPHNPIGPVCTAATIHLSAAVPNFSWLETRVGVSDDGYMSKADTSFFPLHPQRDGASYPVGDLPGLGIEVDEEQITKASFKYWEAPHLKRRDGSVTNW